MYSSFGHHIRDAAEHGRSLSDIDTVSKNIGKCIRKEDNSIHIMEPASRSQNEITKLVMRTKAKERAQIKIEVTPVLRGCVYDPVNMTAT